MGRVARRNFDIATASAKAATARTAVNNLMHKLEDRGKITPAQCRKLAQACLDLSNQYQQIWDYATSLPKRTKEREDALLLWGGVHAQDNADLYARYALEWHEAAKEF
jgi:GMP synthase-like glutamine amidotransferase